MNRLLIILLVVIVSIAKQSHAQTFSEAEQQQIDSLYAMINEPNSHDTTIARSYFELANRLYLLSADTLYYLCSKAEQIAEKGLEFSQDEKVKTSFYETLAGTYSNLGYYYSLPGIMEKSLDYSLKSLQMFEKLGHKEGISTTQNNLASLYSSQGDMDKAEEFYNKSLVLARELKHTYGISSCLNGLAFIESNRKNYKKAIDILDEAFLEYKKANDVRGMAQILNSQGSAYGSLHETDSAISKLEKSIELAKQYDFLQVEGQALNNLAGQVLAKGNSDLALKYAKESMQIVQQIAEPRHISSSAHMLYNIYKQQGSWQEALQNYELYIQMRDSIKNTETQKAAIRTQTKYEFEKEQLIKEQEEKEAVRVETEKIDRRNSLQYSIILVVILIVFGLVLSLGVITVSTKIAEALIFFAFLIFFEFLLVLTDPYVDAITGGAPAYKLLANALLAGLIFPLHSFFENTLKKRLLQKRKS